MNIIPTVSVIIPTYNRERTIKRAIDSVLSQTFKDFELLVMDDGSNDNTKDIINSFYDTRINYYYNKNSGGPAHPRNLGLNKSKGKLIAFLDSDDWWHPKKLEFSLQEINKGNDVVYHDLYYVTSIKQKLFFRKDKSRTFGKNIFEDLIINGNGIPNSSIVLYKKLLKSVGGFNESKNYISWEDYDCWIKISKISSKFSRINKTLGYYWFDGNNITTPYRINARVNEIEKK